MPQILDEVKQLLSQKKEREAVEVLLALLKNGHLELYNRAHHLFSPKKNEEAKKKDDSSPKVSLEDFIKELEQDHKELLDFLKEFQAAKIAFSRQNWGKAKESFTAALSLHKEDYAIFQKDLKNHIKWCKSGLQMKVHLQTGAKAFKEGKWEEAKEAYQLSLKLYQKGFPFPKDKITGSIKACENGQQYEILVGKARHWMTLENWFEARNSFMEAQKIYRRGFVPDISTIDYEIKLCTEALKDDEKNLSVGFLGELRNNPIVILGIIGGLLICTILGAYIIDFNRVSPQVYSGLKKDSLEAEVSLVPDPFQEEIMNEDIEDISESETKEEPIQAVPSIAILPFCETDPILKVVADNLYKEANFQLNRSKGRTKYMNETVVLSHIRRARMNPTQICQQQNVKRIAESIDLTRLMVGTITKNEGGEIQVKYSIYLREEGYLKHTFTVKGQNVQELKAKLKESLDNYMRTL